MRLPQPIAEHRYGRASRLLVLSGQKAAPKDWPNAQHIEIIRGRYHAENALRFTFARQAHLSEATRRDVRKTLLPVAHRLEIGIGKWEGVVAGLAQRQRNDLAGGGKSGNWIQQCGIDPTENRGIRADTQRKRQDFNSCKPRRLRDHPQTVAYVLP